MRWKNDRVSSDIEDRRGEGGGGGFGGFGGGRVRLGCGGFLLLLVLSVVFKKDFFALVGGGGVPAPPSASLPRDPVAPRQESPEERERLLNVSNTLDDTQATWERLFSEMGRRYDRAKLVVFRDAIGSACGHAASSTGPFYCPADRKVYLDLGFFDELDRRFGAPGDFAQAYVVAHEIGHHVQGLLGIEQEVRRLQQSRPDLENALSVRLELQADCFAGLWGHSTESRGILEPGDVEEGLKAAAAIGDDRLQRQARGRVAPETFTHGTSQQRVEWLRRGLSDGRVSACDTFKARSL